MRAALRTWLQTETTYPSGLIATPPELVFVVAVLSIEVIVGAIVITQVLPWAMSATGLAG